MDGHGHSSSSSIVCPHLFFHSLSFFFDSSIKTDCVWMLFLFRFSFPSFLSTLHLVFLFGFPPRATIQSPLPKRIECTFGYRLGLWTLQTIETNYILLEIRNEAKHTSTNTIWNTQKNERNSSKTKQKDKAKEREKKPSSIQNEEKTVCWTWGEKHHSSTYDYKIVKLFYSIFIYYLLRKTVYCHFWCERTFKICFTKLNDKNNQLKW